MNKRLEKELLFFENGLHDSESQKAKANGLPQDANGQQHTRCLPLVAFPISACQRQNEARQPKDGRQQYVFIFDSNHTYVDSIKLLR